MTSNSSCLSGGKPNGMPRFGCFSRYPASSFPSSEQVRSSASGWYSPSLAGFFILWASSWIMIESLAPFAAVLPVTLKKSLLRHSAVDCASVKSRVGSIEVSREAL